jgi:hypothetical protein
MSAPPTSGHARTAVKVAAVVVGAAAVLLLLGRCAAWQQNRDLHAAAASESASYAATQDGWAKSYVDTTCREFVSDMTDGQQLTAADDLLLADRNGGMDQNLGGAPPNVIAKFDSRLLTFCLARPRVKLSSMADEVYMSGSGTAFSKNYYMP